MNTQNIEPSSEYVWLHLGASAFFRAHQADYLNRLKQQGNHNWKVSLANIRNSNSQDTLKQLQQQNANYTLEIISPNGQFEYQTIQCLDQIILWDQQLKSTINVGVNPNTKIISFTVTESGYFLKEDNHLDIDHPAIQSDLLGKEEIQTLYGVIYNILNQRMLNRNGPITLLCCDNLRNNGDSFSTGLHDFISAKNNPELLTWVKTFTSAPNSMVDRITPKVEQSSIDRVNSHLDQHDAVPISCEHYTRWVLEQNFASDYPALSNVGVEFVKDVIPYEEAKIRLLNASHSGLSWFGTLNNKKFIHETLESSICDVLKNYAKHDVKDALKTHQIEINTEVECETILNRFSSPYVKDTVARVSSDSISKLRGFILPTIKDCLQDGKVPHYALTLVALYFYFLEKRHQGKLAFEYIDSALADTAIDQVFKQTDPITAFVQHPALFGSLTEQHIFTEELIKKIHSISEYVNNTSTE